MSQTTERRPRPRSGGRVDSRRLARERMMHRRRRIFLGVVLALAVVLAFADTVHGGRSDPPSRPVAASHGATPSAAAPVRHSATPSSSPSAATVTYPRAGSGDFDTATGRSRVYGDAGQLMRFQVQVEVDITGIDTQRFADQVTDILGDPQGWTAGGLWRFQRVGPGDPHEFVLHLVTPATRDTMCGDVPEGYTSCRNGDNVMINVSRWVHGVPYYHGDLTRYREYAVSHEVGHRLGHGHELCPGAGKPAPTMMQQTLGMHGCVPQPWPYPHGEMYSGPQGDYPQNNIPSDPPSYYTH